MEQLRVLGTGNATVTKCYNTCFAIQKKDAYFLIDAGGGNGILQVLKNNDISLDAIHDIFITHEHSDHILGAVWLVRMIGMKIIKGSYQAPLHIYCHSELVDTIKTLCRLTIQAKVCRLFDEQILFVPLQDGDTKDILDIPFTFFDIRSTKAKQFGFTCRLTNGKKLVFTGDEPCSEEQQNLLDSCDWLLHEAFCLDRDKDIFEPYQKHHATVKDAGCLAEKTGVKNLVLWHTEDRNLERRKELYTKECRDHFRGTVYVPYDNETILLN